MKNKAQTAVCKPVSAETIFKKFDKAAQRYALRGSFDAKDSREAVYAYRFWKAALKNVVCPRVMQCQDDGFVGHIQGKVFQVK